jgi:hypothetical protein
MYANHCANDDYISIYMKVRWNMFGGKFQISFSLSQILCLKLNIYIFNFHYVVDKWKYYEEAMEDLHKVSVHELNNALI